MGERSRLGFLMRVPRRGLTLTYGTTRSDDGETMRGSCKSGSVAVEVPGESIGIFIIGTGTKCSTRGAVEPQGDTTWSPTWSGVWNARRGRVGGGLNRGIFAGIWGGACVLGGDSGSSIQGTGSMT